MSRRKQNRQVFIELEVTDTGVKGKLVFINNAASSHIVNVSNTK